MIKSEYTIKKRGENRADKKEGKQKKIKTCKLE
jgi:hypothetical protein